MNIISSILIVFTILLSVLTFLCLIGWIVKGGINIILPGLGLIIGFPLIIILLLIVQMVFVILALVVKPSQVDAEMRNDSRYNSSRYK